MRARIFRDARGNLYAAILDGDASIATLKEVAAEHFPGIPHDDLEFDYGALIGRGEVGLRKRFPTSFIEHAASNAGPAHITATVRSAPTLAHLLRIAAEAGGPDNEMRVLFFNGQLILNAPARSQSLAA